MKLERLTLKLLSENCYIYHNEENCVLFDPGSDYEHIKEYILSKNLKLSYILLTHCHFDHVGAAADLKEFFNAKIMCHKEDLTTLKLANKSATYYGLEPVKIPEIDEFLEDNKVIDFFGSPIKVIHTPGHSTGSVCFYIQQDNILISGDTLFLESIGRTDFPTGSFEDIIDSIENKLYTLPDDTVVYPGHGFHTTIGYEKKSNPFVQG